MRAPFWLLLLGACVSGIVICSDESLADEIRLKNGSLVTGTVIKRTASEVVVPLGFGTMTFTPEEIVSIEPSSPVTSLPVNAVVAAPAKAPTVSPSPVISDGGGPVSRPAEQTRSATDELMSALKAVGYVGGWLNDGTFVFGSATVLDSKGLIVTNYHVVKDLAQIVVVFTRSEALGRKNDSKEYEARMLKFDDCYDLALLRISAKTPNYIRFADDHEIRAGLEVRAIGNPQGLSVSVSRGVVSAVRPLKEMFDLDTVEQEPVDLGIIDLTACTHKSQRALESFMVIQTDAAINPGNSGGPLLNPKHRMIGINQSGLFTGGGNTGVNFAIHVKHVRQFVGTYLKDE